MKIIMAKISAEERSENENQLKYRNNVGNKSIATWQPASVAAA
jgi:hypothetical protein